MKLNNTLKLIISIGVCELAGAIGSVFTVSAIPNWYAGLVKSPLSPPGWIFGPVWITLYALMGVAVFLIWRTLDQGNSSTKLRIKTALIIFSVQLAVNAIWSIIFFGLKNPAWALVDIIALWILIMATIGVFAKISKSAAWLLAPYLAWVSFAVYLNYSIWRLN